MSLAEIRAPKAQNTQNLPRYHEAYVFPETEKKRVVINDVNVDAERISGVVVSSRIKQHDQIYTTHHNNYMSNGDTQVYSTVQNDQWETSEVRLRFQDGKEKLFHLPFAVSVSEGDLLGIISLYSVKNKEWCATAAQNHTIGQTFSKEESDLKQMCGSLGLIEMAGALSNKSILVVGALAMFFIYIQFSSLLLALFIAVLLTGVFVLAFQYLVLLPYLLVVWPKIDQQFQALFEDFSVWE